MMGLLMACLGCLVLRAILKGYRTKNAEWERLLEEIKQIRYCAPELDDNNAVRLLNDAMIEIYILTKDLEL